MLPVSRYLKMKVYPRAVIENATQTNKGTSIYCVLCVAIATAT